MEPVHKDAPGVDPQRQPIKTSVKRQSPSAVKTDKKIASVYKALQKLEWKSFTAWLSKIFTTPSKRLRNQIAQLKQKIDQMPNEESLAFVSEKARSISRDPLFKQIAKDLQALSTLSTPEQTVACIETARQKLLELIPEGDSWNADLRQELWRLLILTSCDDVLGSVDRFLRHIDKLLDDVIQINSKEYCAIVKDAVSGLKSRLNLVEIENKLDRAKENVPIPDINAQEAFKKVTYYSQKTELVNKTLSTRLQESLKELPNDTLEPYKQLIVHANNPIWCSKEGVKKLSYVIEYLQSQPEDNALLISKIKLHKKAIQELQ